MSICVQQQGFDAGELIERLRGRSGGAGALVSFVGYVRDLDGGAEVSELFLEHYPGMTQKSLEQIAAAARERWALLDLEVLHRVGALAAAEPIVFVGVTSRHRRDAFEACEYIMDQLKTRAPFWKRERTPHGWQWVAARETDSQAAARW